MNVNAEVALQRIMESANMRGILPKFFKYRSARDLIRLGKHYDGGYIVSLSDIKNSDMLIGLGLFDDWSFESDFVKVNDVPVKIYDASVNLRFWVKQTVIQFIKNPFNFYIFRRLISYRKFFRGDKKHIKKFVGLNTEDHNYCTLETVFSDLKAERIFFKIDVEGSEYRFLETLVKQQHRISGLVIELHDCDCHLKAIERFIDDFNLSLVHIHANNFAPVRLDDRLPLVLELTFSRCSELEDCAVLPHPLDMPNKKNESEIELVFEG